MEVPFSKEQLLLLLEKERELGKFYDADAVKKTIAHIDGKYEGMTLARINLLQRLFKEDLGLEDKNDV